MKIDESIKKGGFTLVEIMIVVAIIGLLAAIAIPNFVKARSSSQESACVANLKQIAGAKSTWCLEKKKSLSDTPVLTDLYGAGQYIRSAPNCPGGGTYTISQVDQDPLCSIGAAQGHALPVAAP